MESVRARTQTLTIAAGGTTTPAFKFWDSMVVGFVTPATLTSTIVTFTVCSTADGTFVPLFDSASNEPSVTVTTSEGYAITGSEADALAPWAYFKMVFDQTEAVARDIIITKK